MGNVNYTATEGVKLISGEVGAWLTNTTAESETGVDEALNGDFGTDTLWNKAAGWTIPGGAGANCNGSTGTLSQTTANLEAGKTYLITFDVSGYVAGNVTVYDGGVANANFVNANGSYEFSITSQSAATLQAFSSSFNGTIDNITCDLADSDISDTALALEYTGTITKSAVETGSAVMAYSGFSASDYMTRVYGADIDVTDTISLVGWFNTSGVGNYTIAGNYSSGADDGGCMIDIQAGIVNMTTRTDAGADVSATSTNTYNDGEWHLAIGTVDSTGLVSLYIDGVLADTTSGANMGQTAVLFHVGCYDGGTNPFSTGSLANIKVIAGVVTLAQAKTMYAAEKDLYKEYSIFTIVGTNYDLALSLAGAIRSETPQESSQIALGGQEETTFIRRDVFYSVSVNRLSLSTLPAFRNFMHSVEQKQTFEFDRYGSAASPDNPVNVKMKPGFSENRNGIDDYYRVSFAVREV